MSIRTLPTIILTLLIVTFAPRAQAEEYRRNANAIYAGPKLGFNFATHGGQDAQSSVVESTHKTGLVAGGMAGYELQEWLALHTELLFSMKGTHIVIQGVDSGSLQTNYLTLPILARIALPVGCFVEPNISLGLAPSILLSSKIETNSGNTTDHRDETNSFDLGFVMSGGVGVALGRSMVLDLEVRYEWGLLRIDATEDSDDIKNRVISFGLGIRFDVGL